MYHWRSLSFLNQSGFFLLSYLCRFDEFGFDGWLEIDLILKSAPIGFLEKSMLFNLIYCEPAIGIFVENSIEQAFELIAEVVFH